MWGILGNGVQVKITEQRMLVNEFFFLKVGLVCFRQSWRNFMNLSLWSRYHTNQKNWQLQRYLRQIHFGLSSSICNRFLPYFTMIHKRLYKIFYFPLATSSNNCDLIGNNLFAAPLLLINRESSCEQYNNFLINRKQCSATSTSTPITWLMKFSGIFNSLSNFDFPSTIVITKQVVKISFIS